MRELEESGLLVGGCSGRASANGAVVTEQTSRQAAEPHSGLMVLPLIVFILAGRPVLVAASGDGDRRGFPPL